MFCFSQLVLHAGRLLGMFLGGPSSDAAGQRASEASSAGLLPQHAQQASESQGPVADEQVPQHAQQTHEASALSYTDEPQHAQRDSNSDPSLPEAALSQLPTATAVDEQGFENDHAADQRSGNALGDMDWEREQEVEREALEAGQQLARDNSQALNEVRQAMQTGIYLYS